MVAFAHYAPKLVFSFYPALSRKMLAAISKVTSPLPFALWEVLAGLLILWAIYTLIRCFSHKGFLRWLAGLLLGASVGVFLFVGLWGLNHFGPTVGESLGLNVREYSEQELLAATKYYASEANRLAGSVERDADGLAVFDDFSALSKQAGAGYTKLAAQYSQFTGSVDPVKKLATWRLFSQTGTTGIFVDFTAESCVNPDTYEAWIPFTMRSGTTSMARWKTDSRSPMTSSIFLQRSTSSVASSCRKPNTIPSAPCSTNRRASSSMAPR